ncbi:MAG: glycosyltransferase [Acidobacteriota bacterium]|nr:glycosyltransferase [Acidobacteriota bacterium]
MPKISVIIATRNRHHLLARAVKSAIEAGTDLEVVVVDDASSPETAEVCRSLPGIKYVRAERNLKLGGARNLGLLASSGEYITFLDDDDVRLPGSLDVQVDKLSAKRDAGLIYGQAFHGDSECLSTGTLYPLSCPQGDIFWELLEWNFIPCPTTVFRRSCIYRVGLLSEDCPGIEDWDLWLRIAALYPVLSVETPVAIWRQPTPTSDQYTSKPVEMLVLSTRLFYKRWLTLPRVLQAGPKRRRELCRRFKNRVADQLMWETARAIKDKQLRYALRTGFTMLSLYPSGVFQRAARATTFRFFIKTISMGTHFPLKDA